METRNSCIVISGIEKSCGTSRADRKGSEESGQDSCNCDPEYVVLDEYHSDSPLTVRQLNIT